MADLNSFEDTAHEEDPAADFLAREQEELAQIEGNDTGDLVTSAPGPNENLSEFDSAVPANGPSTFNEERQSDFPDDISGDGGQGDSGQGDAGQSEGGQGDAGQETYAAVSQADKLQQEPEKIRKWREEQKLLLEEKDREAEIKKEEWRKVASQELVDWYKHCEEQLVKNKANNKESESVFVKERDEVIPGHEWERICRMCDFNPKTARNQKDVARMRSILLHLKQNSPERA